jgi:hypothetical protein
MNDAGPPRSRRSRPSAGRALAGMAAELLYAAALAGVGALIAMAATLLR